MMRGPTVREDWKKKQWEIDVCRAFQPTCKRTAISSRDKWGSVEEKREMK